MPRPKKVPTIEQQLLNLITQTAQEKRFELCRLLTGILEKLQEESEKPQVGSHD